MEYFIELHTKVKLRSGIEGTIIGVWQEIKGGDIQYLVKFWNVDGEVSTMWYPTVDFDTIK